MSEDILDKLSAEREIKTIGRIGGGGGVVMMSCDIVQEAIAEITRLREERRWIPVVERLPESAQRVWAFVPAVYGAQEARWVDGHWRDHFGRVGPVTHWQPLPAPPNGGEVE